MRTGFDYSFQRPHAHELVAAGASFVCRYLSHDGSKNIDGVGGSDFPTGELAELRAYGLAVVLNWETTEQRALSGMTGGGSDALEAKRQAHSLGAPDDCAIYFSCDWDVQDGELQAVERYLAGAAEVLGASRVGVYGGRRVVTAMLDRHAARWAWQTYAWSGGRWDSRAHLRQVQNGVMVGGAQVDRDLALVELYGQWRPPAKHPPPPPPAPDPRPRWWRRRPFLAEWVRRLRR